jgi:hypothetical protein
MTDTLRRSMQAMPLGDCLSQEKATKRKSKSVRFDTSGPESKRRTPEPTGDAQINQTKSFTTFDLKAAQSVCDHLSQACASTSTCPDPCLGYLEHCSSVLSSRLIFYDASRNNIVKKHGPKGEREARKVIELLQSLRTVHQLTLAHQLAVAILQYHSTAWIAPDWSLEDISYFRDLTKPTTEAIEDQLQSLHLSTQFPFTGASAAKSIIQHQEDLKFVYGIRNLPLAKLGIALIEIGCQTKISSLASSPMPHDVICARRVLLDPPPAIKYLGERYLKIARKCIECDFSCGDDLTDENVQSAVYTEVVCGLESMLQDLKKFLNIK